MTPARITTVKASARVVVYSVNDCHRSRGKQVGASDQSPGTNKKSGEQADGDCAVQPRRRPQT